MKTLIKGTYIRSFFFLFLPFMFLNLLVLGLSILLILSQKSEGQSQEIIRGDKMNLVCFLENKLQEAKKNNDQIRMKYNDSPVQTGSFPRKPVKRSIESTSPIKRVILGRKNQLIRMMKKRNNSNGTNPNNFVKSRYLRIN